MWPFRTKEPVNFENFEKTHGKFPSSKNANAWMTAKVEFYKKNYPHDLSNLFDRSCGDYLPLSIHVGSSFEYIHLVHYRKLKSENKKVVNLIDKSNQRWGFALVGDPLD